MTIVRADGPEVHDAVVELFVAYRHFYGLPDDDEAARVFLRRRLELRDSMIWVATTDGQVAGFVQVYPVHESLGLRTEWLLNDLFVDPSVRSRGTGGALVQRVLDEASRNGVARVLLETQPGNRTARAVYEHLGFVLDEHTLAQEYLTYTHDLGVAPE